MFFKSVKLLQGSKVLTINSPFSYFSVEFHAKSLNPCLSLCFISTAFCVGNWDQMCSFQTFGNKLANLSCTMCLMTAFMSNVKFFHGLLPVYLSKCNWQRSEESNKILLNAFLLTWSVYTKSLISFFTNNNFNQQAGHLLTEDFLHWSTKPRPSVDKPWSSKSIGTRSGFPTLLVDFP